jgi:hypothetical protein
LNFALQKCVFDVKHFRKWGQWDNLVVPTSLLDLQKCQFWNHALSGYFCMFFVRLSNLYCIPTNYIRCLLHESSSWWLWHWRYITKKKLHMALQDHTPELLDKSA